MTNKLKPFKQESFAATQAQWKAAADALDIPFLDYEVQLDWAARHLDYGIANGNSLAYGIFEGKSAHAQALVEIVYTQRPGNNWLKMLSVKLSPSLAPAVVDADPLKIVQVLDIYAEAVRGTVELTGSHKAKVVKIYGRNESLLRLLVALHERLKSGFADKLVTKMEGRWLVIKGK
jgi:hypothetical protein